MLARQIQSFHILCPTGTLTENANVNIADKEAPRILFNESDNHDIYSTKQMLTTL